MSDLVKAQNMPQFNWYTRWMSLGANGTPDKLIEEGLKQPNRNQDLLREKLQRLKLQGDHRSSSAQPGSIWRRVLPLVHAPNFKSKILTQLSDVQKANGPFLFNLMGQCFQGVGLTEWTSIIAKQFPNNADRMNSNFIECIRDYLEAVARFPNIGDQLICWLRTSKKPTLMPMHKFMRRWVQFLSYLEGGYLRWTMDVPTAQEKSEQIFFAQPKAHQNKFANLNKMVPTDPLKMIAFFEQCQATNKVAGILEKIAKDKQPKGKENGSASCRT